MTMPHLMNCLHYSDTGWCLDCVKELYDQQKPTLTKIAVRVREDVYWTVMLCGDRCQIVDEDGRQRLLRMILFTPGNKEQKPLSLC